MRKQAWQRSTPDLNLGRLALSPHSGFCILLWMGNKFKAAGREVWCLKEGSRPGGREAEGGKPDVLGREVKIYPGSLTLRKVCLSG